MSGDGNSAEGGLEVTAGRREPEAGDTGSREAQLRTLERLLSAHRQAMLAVARRFEGRVNRADDIVQQASLEALSAAHKLPVVICAEAWLLGITRNVGLRVVAKRKRRARLDEALLAACPDWACGGRDDDLKQTDSLAESRDRLLGATCCLPPSLRMVVYGMLDDMEDDLLAERAAIAKATVRVRRHRAIHRLRAHLRAQDPAGDRAHLQGAVTLSVAGGPPNGRATATAR